MKHFTLKSEGGLEHYDYLWRLTPDRWAWEFLRRNAAFRRDASAVPRQAIAQRTAKCAEVRLLRPRTWQTLAERWGLVLMPDPALDAYQADVVWTRRAFPDQVEITCVPREPDQSCEIWDEFVPSCDITHVSDRLGNEFLLLRRHGFVLQVRCTGTSLLGLDPVRIKLTISGLRGYYRRCQIQKTAMDIYRQPSGPAQPRWSKTTQILRNGVIALDGLAAGMGRREIASLLYGQARVHEEWHGPSLQHTLHYAIRKAEGLRDGRYLPDLLSRSQVRAARTSAAGARAIVQTTSLDQSTTP